MKELRYASRSNELVTTDQQRVAPVYYGAQHLAPLERVADVSLAAFVRSARDYTRHTGRPRLLLRLATESAALFDQGAPDDFPSPALVRLESDGSHLDVAVRNFVYADAPDEPQFRALFEPAVEDFLRRNGGEVAALVFDAPNAHGPTTVDVTIRLETRRRAVEDAYGIGRVIYRALDDALRGNTGPATTQTLLESNHPSLLVGEPESAWLEAKQQPYRLDEEGERLELAKDVAAIANSGVSGILLLGFATRSVGGRDVIRAVRPFEVQNFDRARYRDILRRHVFPNLEGVEIRTRLLHGTRGIAYIEIPTQPPQLRPFMIGLTRRSQVHEHFVSIPVRHDARVEFSSIANLHSLLVAGQAALAASGDDSP